MRKEINAKLIELILANHKEGFADEWLELSNGYKLHLEFAISEGGILPGQFSYTFYLYIESSKPMWNAEDQQSDKARDWVDSGCMGTRGLIRDLKKLVFDWGCQGFFNI